MGFDGYIGSNSATDLGEAPDGFCAPQLHNTQWLGFVAGTPSISMNITAFNCDSGNGLQIGIYNTLDCTDFSLVSNCEPTMPENIPFVFNATGLMPGGIYFLVIDGNFGDICEFSIDVTSGLAEAPPIVGNTAIVGVGPFCPGGTFDFGVAGVSGASIYEWTLNGAPAGYEQNISVSVPTSGSSFELCVTPSNPCETGPQTCQTFPITPLPPIVESATICDGDVYTLGNTSFNTTGTYNFSSFTDEGCLQQYTLHLTVVPPVFAQVQGEICEGEVFSVHDNFGNNEIFTQAGVYQVLLQASNSGCDSVLTVELIVHPFYNNVLQESICEGESIVITDGINTYTHTTTGAYSHVLQSSEGCDSLVNLALFVYPVPSPVYIIETICPDEYFFIGDFFAFNSPGIHTATIESIGGCDSTVTVNLSINDPLTTIDTTICPGQEVVIGSETYDVTGFYTTTLTSYLGCDSIVELDLIVQTPIETILNTAICEGDSVLLGSTYYYANGTYMDVLTATSGCDSTVTLNLTVNNNSVTDLLEEICAGSGYAVGDSTYTSTGNYQNILPASNGCDSIVNLDLRVLTEITNDLDAEICDGDTYEVGDSTFTVTGQYSVVLMAQAGCDSTVNLDLTVLEIPETLLDIAICFGNTYEVGNSSYSTNGSFTDVLTASTGCDSIVMLDLEVIEAYRDTLNIAICTGLTYQVGTSVYGDPGSYIDTLTASIGCDSIVYLFLQVEDVLRDTLFIEICEGDSYPLGNNTYNQTGFYNESFITSQGCDSVASLDLTVHPILYTELTESICDGESFAVGGSVYTQTGNFQDIFSSEVTGCDSVVNLILTVLNVPEVSLVEAICDGESFSVGTSSYNSSGSYVDTLMAINGCDSIVSLDLTVLDVPITALVEAICDGDSYPVGNSSYNQAGNSVDTLTAANGCDSIVFLNLTILDVPVTNLTELICDGFTFEVGSSSYGSTGNYTDILLAANGCDSIVNLDLTVATNPVTNLNISICQGSSYMVGDSTYTLSGSYTNLLTSSVGCDSTVNLTLNVTSFYETPVSASICDGESYLLGSDPYTETGEYSAQFLAQDGCDSFVYLSLTVFDIPLTTLDITICDGESVTVGNTPYTTTGVFNETLTAFTGCDSLVTLNLTVNDVYTTDLVVSICDGDGFPVGNSIYTEAGDYQDILVAANGCDSTVNLNLNVIPIEQTSLDITICEGESYPVGGSIYSSSGNYQDVIMASTGCDSIVNLELTVIPTLETFLIENICDGDTYQVGNSVYTVDGNYVDSLVAGTGCDSIVYLNLTIDPVYVTELTEIICDDETYEVGGLSFSSSGIFQVPLSSVSGCDSTIILDLTTHPCELAITMSEGSVTCFGLSDGFIDFAMTIGTPPYTYNWFALDGSTNGSGSIDGNDLNTLISELPAGNYRIVVVDAFEIEYQVMVTIQQPDPIDLALALSDYGGYNTSCNYENDGFIQSTVTGGVLPYQYQWSNGDNGTGIDELVAGNYNLLITDSNGCEESASANLDAPQAMFGQAEVTDPACFGDTQGIINVTEAQGGVGPYLYSINNQAFTSSSLFANLAVGEYELQIQDANGCVWEENYTILQPEELIVDLGEDIFIKLGESAQLEAFTTYPVDAYQWKNSVTLDCFGDTLDLDCFNPNASPMFTSTYVVTVVDENGCSNSDEITVFVDRRRQVYIPNVFSPNGDGQNDNFYVYTGPDVAQIKSFLIFNRWGEAVYELYGFPSNDPDYGWNGMHRGQLMNTGVYVYYAVVEFLDGEVIEYKGDITLMK
ncbi:MAG: hypothetical protein DHS20C18_13270 [Saprospiraceae bacterium]|nr:MAG: hypothetical protein DHS20C18_13270 [Saprospiraceae bacterium]